MHRNMKSLSILLGYTLISSICSYSIQLFKDCWCDSFNCFHDPPMAHHSNECQCSRMPASSATNNGPLSHRAGGNKAVFPKSSICFPGLLARPPWEESICSQQQDVWPQFLRRGTLGISANTRLYGVCITGSVVIQRPWPLSIRRPWGPLVILMTKNVPATTSNGPWEWEQPSAFAYGF